MLASELYVGQVYLDSNDRVWYCVKRKANDRAIIQELDTDNSPMGSQIYYDSCFNVKLRPFSYRMYYRDNWINIARKGQVYCVLLDKRLSSIVDSLNERGLTTGDEFELVGFDQLAAPDYYRFVALDEDYSPQSFWSKVPWEFMSPKKPSPPVNLEEQQTVCPECNNNPNYSYKPFWEPGVVRRACSLCKGNAILQST